MEQPSKVKVVRERKPKVERPPKVKVERTRKVKAEVRVSTCLSPVLTTIELLLNIISYIDYSSFCAFRSTSVTIWRLTQSLGFQLRDKELVKHKLNPIAVAQVYQNVGYLRASTVSRKKLAKEAREQLIDMLLTVSDINLVRAICLRLFHIEQRKEQPEEFPDAPYAKIAKPVKNGSAPTDSRELRLVARIWDEKCQARFASVGLLSLLPHVTVENEYLLSQLMATCPLKLLNHIIYLDDEKLYAWFMTHVDLRTVTELQQQYEDIMSRNEYKNTLSNILGDDKINIFKYLQQQGPDIPGDCSLLYEDSVNNKRPPLRGLLTTERLIKLMKRTDCYCYLAVRAKIGTLLNFTRAPGFFNNQYFPPT